MRFTHTVHLAIVLVVAATCSTAAGADTIWYNTQSDYSSDSHLYGYDVSSGLTSDYGTVQGLSLLTDIAFGSDGTLYGVGFADSYGHGPGMLYSITPGSATSYATYTALTVNGSLSGAVNGLAAYGNDLYVSSGDKQFYHLAAGDNGVWDVVAQGKMSHASSGDLAFGSDGTLYATVTIGNRASLATIDLAEDGRRFGRDSKVHAKMSYSGAFGLACVDDTLYGLAGNGNFGHSDLVVFDPSTGQTTTIAELNGSAWGMTAAPTVYQSACAAPEVPEPSTLGLLLVGVIGVVAQRTRGRAR